MKQSIIWMYSEKYIFDQTFKKKNSLTIKDYLAKGKFQYGIKGKIKSFKHQ